MDTSLLPAEKVYQGMLQTNMLEKRIQTEAVHNGKKYPCDQCDFKATQSGSLKIHQKNQHKIGNIISIDRT